MRLRLLYNCHTNKVYCVPSGIRLGGVSVFLVNPVYLLHRFLVESDVVCLNVLLKLLYRRGSDDGGADMLPVVAPREGQLCRRQSHLD